MQATTRTRALQIVLVAFGGVALLVYPLMRLWPAGFAWSPRQGAYEQMIAGLYATLGVFLIRAAREPARHASLIWFTVWSSVVHGGIMAVQAAVMPMERMHLAGDVPLLLAAAAVLAVLAPRAADAGG
ncbi:MAG: hypothetical protein JSR73_14060 [Proteobacteria bacterium]|nr:hypothetical protein [Pseudomonadota bacterium]